MFSSIHCKKCLRFALRKKKISSAGLNQEAWALLPAISKNFATAWACRMLPRESATINRSSTDGDWPTSQHMVGEGLQLKMLEIKKTKNKLKTATAFSVQFILYVFMIDLGGTNICPAWWSSNLKFRKRKTSEHWHIIFSSTWFIHSFFHHHQQQQ